MLLTLLLLANCDYLTLDSVTNRTEKEHNAHDARLTRSVQIKCLGRCKFGNSKTLFKRIRLNNLPLRFVRFRDTVGKCTRVSRVKKVAGSLGGKCFFDSCGMEAGK